MKENIKTALKTKFKSLGLDESIFESYAEALSVTVTEESQIETAIAGVEPILKSFQASADKIRTAHAQKYKTLEDKIKNIGGEPEPNPQPQPDDNTPEWAKLLVSSHKALMGEFETLKGEKLKDYRSTQIKDVISKLPTSMQAPYNRLDLAKYSDDEFEAFKTELSSEIDGITTELTAKGAVFTTPKGGAGGGSKTPQPTESEVKELESKINFDFK